MANLTADDRGYAFAFATSLRLARAADLYGDWFAPGWHSKSYDAQPNQGTCECGEGYFVADFYHYRSLDGIRHTRSLCV